MNRKLPRYLILMATLSTAIASAAPPQRDFADAFNADRDAGSDNFKHPLGEKQKALKEKAKEAQLLGKTSGKTHEVAKGQYVELEREGEDLIWTVTGEFGDTPSWHAGESNGLGPQHNQIPEPDRDVDNTQRWVPDFNRDHFMQLLFDDEEGANSLRNFYIEQSSNRYSVSGDVTDWGQVEYNTAHYGTYDSTVWWFIEDSVGNWYDKMVANGWSPADFEEYLSKFDVWDRYDYDGDNNFDEPDGYIDHFQSVHAGMGEEAGGGIYGADAIWSHSWYANNGDIGDTGPAWNLAGGIQIGGTDYWIGNYTVEPEDGGVGVFAHEFGHDLGLPDLYNTGGGPGNSTAFWTLMSSGSWLSQNPENIASAPGHMGNWEKYQMGWLNYEVAYAGSKSEHKLGPAETNTKQAQGLFVVLPDIEVVENIGDPYSGSYFYYSGSGNDLSNAMYRSVTLPAGAISLDAMVNYSIELDWDYAYLLVDGVPVATDRSTNTDPNANNFGEGITGATVGWETLNADLSAFAGQTVEIAFYYWTDGAFVDLGFMVDDIQITGLPLDDAESDFGWTYEGFIHTTGTETGYYFNAYVAEFRQYRGYDVGLQTGPYNYIGFDTVEHFPYQDGLLISYWDSSQSDNNTATHPGKGLILPIDAHPESMINGLGGDWRARIQSYDSTFSIDSTDMIELHAGGVPSIHGGLPGAKIFDDTNQYWNPAIPVAGVMNPNTGTQIRIQSVSAQGSFMQVEVRPSK
jgi:immune inhibitor A